MKALLLAAGLGTRLRPLTDILPKCLVPIHGIPLIRFWLDMLANAGVKDILVNLHYKSDLVKEYIEYSPYRNVHFAYETELLGTAGTLLKNRHFFGDDSVMLIHADNLSFFDVSKFIEAHTNRPENTVMTMMSFKTPAPETCGILELDRENVVIGFHEKVQNPPGNLANGAVYIVESSLYGFLESLNLEFIDFSTQVIPEYIGKIFAFHNGVYHRDIGSLESFVEAQKDSSKFTRDFKDEDWKKFLQNRHPEIIDGFDRFVKEICIPKYGESLYAF